jgi:hypothetical protein
MNRATAIKESAPVHFITSRDESGCECYFVVRATPANINKIRAAKGKVINIAEYAEILNSGFGKIPVASVRKELEARYNIVIPVE